MSTLTATLKASISSKLENSLDKGTAQSNESDYTSMSVANGTGASQGNQQFFDTRSLNAGANEELDLAGSLTNGLGATVTFARVVAIKITAASTNGSTLSVFGAAANGFDTMLGAAGDKIKIRPGGGLMLWCSDATAYAVTAGTGDLLKVENDDGGAAASYTIDLLGSE